MHWLTVDQEIPGFAFEWRRGPIERYAGRIIALGDGFDLLQHQAA
jgi:hypothetical protein